MAGRSQGPDRFVAIMVSVRELVTRRMSLGYRSLGRETSVEREHLIYSREIPLKKLMR